MSRHVFALLILLILGLAQGLVGLESFRFHIPPPSDLSKSEGTAFFDVGTEYKRGLPLGIKTAGGDVFVTCRVTTIQSTDCINPRDRASIEGKQVTVWWTEQPIFLWQREKRAFQIDVAGVSYLSHSKLARRYENQSPDWFSVCISLLLLGIVAFAMAYLRNKHLLQHRTEANILLPNETPSRTYDDSAIK